MPFASRRRWSAVALGEDVLALGAPELFSLGRLGAVAKREARPDAGSWRWRRCRQRSRTTDATIRRRPARRCWAWSS